MKIYDLIIIGTGPAGLTAAIYAARYNLDALVIGIIPGGTAGEAYKICNFPSYAETTGVELMTKMINQVKKLGVEIKSEEVLNIEKNADFKVKTNKKEYFAKKIIIAAGLKRRKLIMEREKEFIGKGINYCATCDAGFYKDKIVGIVGGGNSALTSALLSTEFAKKVYIIYRKPRFFRAEPAWVKDVEKNKKIISIFNANITKLKGKDRLESVELDNGKELKLDGLFVEIGSVPGIGLAEKLKIKTDKNFIKVDKKQRTNISGVFAAGDITDNPLKQIITACGEGAIAANTAYNELGK